MCSPQCVPLHFSVVTAGWVWGPDWPAGITHKYMGHRKTSAPSCSEGPEKVECVRSLVLKHVFKIKGSITKMIAETTADGNTFLESRGLCESQDLKGQAMLQNRFET